MFAAKREGLSLLADVAALGLNYQHDAVVTTQKFIRENRDTVGKYVKAQIDAVHFVKSNPEAGVKILAKYLRQLKDRDSLQQSYEISVADHMIPRKQYPSREGIQTILDELAPRNPRANRPSPMTSSMSASCSNSTRAVTSSSSTRARNSSNRHDA